MTEEETKHLKNQYILGEQKFESFAPVGTKVKIVRSAKTYEKGWDNIWNEEMEKLVGKEFDIEFYAANMGSGVELLGWGFPFFVLEVVPEKPFFTLFSMLDWEPEPMPKPKIEVGQIYLYSKTDFLDIEYIVTRITLIDSNVLFQLTNLNTGNGFSNPNTKIENIFNGSRERFTLKEE